MKDDVIIKVGFCVAYDWELLQISLPKIYKYADVICLGLDKDRHAWSGESYTFDNEKFFQFVAAIDVDKKIVVYEDDFSIPTLNKRENCNRHRTLISEKLGKGGWHIQIDADEYFLDFEGFVAHLKKLNPKPTPSQKAINVCCPFIPLLKKVQGGYLMVDFKNSLPEIIPIATNRPDYQRARQNGHFNHVTQYYVIHETWSRGEDELWYKINNWGHASEELSEPAGRQSYFNLWKSLDKLNYKYVSNFHPIKPSVWPALLFSEGNDIVELIQKLNLPKFPFSKFELAIRNNRNIARIRSLVNRLK